MTRKRKDANHRDIVEALEKSGVHCIDMTGDPAIGFDLLLIYRSHKEIVEVKDGDKPESARRLTDGETNRKTEVERRGVPYRIVESVDDALRLMGIIR